jgi:pimeloyl-ACP methyl ester carboxylesterase
LAPATNETVVLIPGLWFPAVGLRYLGHHLGRRGYDVRYFSYPSVRHDLRENAARLNAFLAGIEVPVIHLVGHSLGGILIRALFRFHPQQKPGRVVTLGSPHGGSVVARRKNASRAWRRLMGRGVAQMLLGVDWPAPGRDIGTIAGRRSFGLGRVAGGRLPMPNDGLLTEDETRIAGATDVLALPVSHSGMLFSPEVARAVAAFLADGHFHGRTG